MKGEKSIVTPGEGEVTNETYGFVSCNGKFSWCQKTQSVMYLLSRFPSES